MPEFLRLSDIKKAPPQVVFSRFKEVTASSEAAELAVEKLRRAFFSSVIPQKNQSPEILGFLEAKQVVKLEYYLKKKIEKKYSKQNLFHACFCVLTFESVVEAFSKYRWHNPFQKLFDQLLCMVSYLSLPQDLSLSFHLKQAASDHLFENNLSGYFLHYLQFAGENRSNWLLEY
jgi:hypothetical protein